MDVRRVSGYGQVHLSSQNYPRFHDRYPQIVHNLRIQGGSKTVHAGAPGLWDQRQRRIQIGHRAVTGGDPCKRLLRVAQPALDPRPELAHRGGRDHSTVMHAVDKITAMMRERHQIYNQVTDLIVRIKSGGA